MCEIKRFSIKPSGIFIILCRWPPTYFGICYWSKNFLNDWLHWGIWQFAFFCVFGEFFQFRRVLRFIVFCEVSCARNIAFLYFITCWTSCFNIPSFIQYLNDEIFAVENFWTLLFWLFSNLLWNWNGKIYWNLWKMD